MADKPTLLVRADASPEIGAGHVMRCLALAEAWLELGGQVTFASAQLPDAITARITRTGATIAQVRTPEDGAALAQAIGARFAVVDGYRLGAAVQEALAATGARVLVIDDLGETATSAAALVLNQNAGATPALYAHLRARLLLGSKYVLLRREFRAAAAEPRRISDVATRVLVSFGGADPLDVTPRAIEALAPLDGFDVLVVAGMANPRAGELRAPDAARASIRIVGGVDDMAAHMRWADLAVVAAGSTCWEVAACGVPMIAVAVADNQRAVAQSLATLGIGVPLSVVDVDSTSLHASIVSLASDLSRRTQMSQRAREVIDGQGAFRVCAVLRGDGDAG